jgi:hypothetical protein
LARFVRDCVVAFRSAAAQRRGGMSLVVLGIATCVIYSGLFLLVGAGLWIYVLRGGILGFKRPQNWRDVLPYARLFALLWLVSYTLAFAILAYRFPAKLIF